MSIAGKKYVFLTLMLGMTLLLVFSRASIGQRLPDKPDERFYACLERLILKYGNNQKSWPDFREKRIVAEYLKNVHALELKDVIFARNFLGLGIGNSPEEAKNEMNRGQADAWGVPYDLIIASSRGQAGKMDILQGIFINQGLGLYNKELSENTYVVPQGRPAQPVWATSLKISMEYPPGSSPGRSISWAAPGSGRRRLPGPDQAGPDRGRRLIGQHLHGRSRQGDHDHP